MNATKLKPKNTLMDESSDRCVTLNIINKYLKILSGDK